jgi:peptidoglycan/LPS O-acetylase OafA/YrhL
MTIGPGQRIHSLDGLRGIALLVVVLFHIDLFLGQAGEGVGARFYHHMVSFGWCGVDLFFVLSGFLITGILYDTLNEEGYYRRFYVRRALRIFPVYYLFLACFFLIVPVLLVALGRGHVIPTSVRPSTQGFAWFYLVNWFEGLRELNYFAPSIQHFWSLGVEEQFYLAWPFVVKSLPAQTLKRLTLALVAGSLVARCLLSAYRLDGAAYTWTVCRMDAIALGALVALTLRDPRESVYVRTGAPWATAIGFLLFAATSLLGRRLSGSEFWMHAFGPTLLGLFFAGVLVMATSPSPNLVRTVGLSPPLRHVGMYSYAAYVWHQPIVIALKDIGFRAEAVAHVVGSWVLTLVIVNAVPLLIAAIVSVASWHLFESWFLQFKDDPRLLALTPPRHVSPIAAQ